MWKHNLLVNCALHLFVGHPHLAVDLRKETPGTLDPFSVWTGSSAITVSSHMNSADLVYVNHIQMLFFVEQT